jgi:hypothetical protein
MKRVFVTIERTGVRKTVEVQSGRANRSGFERAMGDVNLCLGEWVLGALIEAVTTGLCQSFGVAVHVDGPDCDHETFEVPEVRDVDAS